MLGKPWILWYRAEQLVAVVAGFESVVLDGCCRVPPGRRPDALGRDFAEGVDEVCWRVASDATQVPGEERVDAPLDFGEPVDLGPVYGVERVMVVVLALEPADLVFESLNPGAVALDRCLQDHAVGVWPAESFPHASGAECREPVFVLGEEDGGVGSLALECGEFGARIGWRRGEPLAQRAPLSEQRAQVWLSVRCRSGVDGELLGVGSPECEE